MRVAEFRDAVSGLSLPFVSLRGRATWNTPATWWRPPSGTLPTRPGSPKPWTGPKPPTQISAGWRSPASGGREFVFLLLTLPAAGV